MTKTPEMVERVARAIAEADNRYRFVDQHSRDRMMARAAIEAMRDDLSLTALPASKAALFCCSEDPTLDAARLCFRATINAALS